MSVIRRGQVARARPAPALLALGLALTGAAWADPPAGAEFEMAQYRFVLIRRAAVPPPMGERAIQATQERHVAYFTRLAGEGKLLIEGPLSRAGALTGALVLDVPTTDDARRILDDDPWIRSGRYTYEVHAWWAAKGVLTPPTDLGDQVWSYLGILRRPPDAPDLDDERLQALQAGHLANIRKMAEAGELLIAGPMVEDTPLRGIFVFRESSPEKIAGLVAEDPSIRAGRLSIDLYPWRVPRGALPRSP